MNLLKFFLTLSTVVLGAGCATKKDLAELEGRLERFQERSNHLTYYFRTSGYTVRPVYRFAVNLTWIGQISSLVIAQQKSTASERKKRGLRPRFNGLMRSAQGRPLSGWLLPGPTIILKLDAQIARCNGTSRRYCRLCRNRS